jgi:hypothetical protein
MTWARCPVAAAVVGRSGSDKSSLHSWSADPDPSADGRIPGAQTLMSFLLSFRRALAQWIYPTSELSDLRIQLAEASTARIVAEGNSRFWQDEHTSMQERLEESHKETIDAHKRLTDLISQQRYGQQMYGTLEIPAVTPDSAKPVYRTGIQGRAMVQRGRRDFRDAMLNQLNPSAEISYTPDSAE